MKSFYFLLIALIIIYLIIKNQEKYAILSEFTILDDSGSISDKDFKYLQKFKTKQLIKLTSNNKINNPPTKKNHISIITFDNRPTLPYVVTHNDNITNYSKKWGYDYKFYDACSYNIYWCKIHMVLDELKTGKYDYVMWMDSDTYIFNMGINLSDILNSYSSDIFVGSDNHKSYDLINAGVFIIKNTSIGIQFLQECIDSMHVDCVSNDMNSGISLKGNWAGTCYEQGVMNILIADKYYKNTTVLSNDIIYNYGKCSKDVFIMHLYGSSTDTRVKCFCKSIIFFISSIKLFAKSKQILSTEIFTRLKVDGKLSNIYS